MSLASDRPDWAHEQGSQRQEQGGGVYYTSTVVVRRKGDFVFPVDLVVKFDDGQQALEHWDGRDRWIRYTYHLPARVVSAELDPDREVWLDRNLFNNSRTAEGDGAATRKLANYWLLLTQFLSQIVTGWCESG